MLEGPVLHWGGGGNLCRPIKQRLNIVLSCGAGDLILLPLHQFNTAVCNPLISMELRGKLRLLEYQVRDVQNLRAGQSC